MISFPSMLVGAAHDAGIATPPNIDNYDPEEFAHWHVLCLTQLDRPMDWGEHFENAKALAKIDKERLKTITVRELQEAGCNCGV